MNYATKIGLQEDSVHIHSFIHLLIIPESITGTEPMDIELVIPCIVQYIYSSNIYIYN
jgi:hypothetical protein